jgi:hypothetical protein
LVKKEAISLTRLVENCNSDSLYSRPGCHVVSKAFSMSKNTAAVNIKPNWLAFSKFVSSMCLWIILRINLPKSLPVVDRRLIGRKFHGKFGFLPGFGRAIILVSFQDAGKWQSACLCQVKVKVTLRLMVSQSVSKSWCRAPSGAHDQIFFTVWHLRSCFCGDPLLTRGRICLLYMMLALASAVFLRSESLGTSDHFLLSQIWDFPFRRLLQLAGSLWRYSTPPPHGYLPSEAESESYVTTDGQSASLSWYKAPIRAYDQIFIAVRNTEYVGQLRVCWYEALSLTRGRVCRLQLLLALASALCPISGSIR